MLACSLGCDALFEHGYIGVDHTGTVRDLSSPHLTAVSTYAKTIVGRHCAAHTDQTADKFASHLTRAKSPAEDR